MRRLQTRNTQTAYYQLYTGKTEGVDSNGYKTGRYTETYGEKTKFRPNVSFGATGIFAGNNAKMLQEPYGIRDEHSITLYTDRDYGIDARTLLWIGDTDKANYQVTSISPSLMGYTITAKQMMNETHSN